MVIDVEKARRIGEQLPEMARKCPWPGDNTCSSMSDLYMIGKMLSELPAELMDTNLKALRDLLLSKTACFEAQLSVDQVMECHTWLQSVTPSSSPSGGHALQRRGPLQLRLVPMLQPGVRLADRGL